MVQENLKQIEENAIKEIEAATKSEILEEVRAKYIGKKGEITMLLKTLSSLSPEERPIIGNLVNSAREKVESLIEEKSEKLKLQEIEDKMKNEVIDISITKKNDSSFGNKHPISIVIDEMKDIFIGMGYSIAEGPDIEYAKYNFDALNTPKDHPSRDSQDTFYITEDIVLRSQTSTVQVRTMLNQKPPIKIISPGRVYRSDDVDATHSPMFHQVEGLVADKGITMADLKGTLELFVKKYFGEDTKIRLRPHFFPFTEPSCEVDVTCCACGGVGCRVCKKEGYIEILGAGMVHPNVLKACGIDPNIYSGFAFGMGVERIAMKKFGINDLRFLYENDVRFLNQF